MREQKRHWKHWVVGASTIAVGLMVGGRIQQVCAQEGCGVYSGSPSGEPGVRWDCVEVDGLATGEVKAVPLPVDYEQTVQNPCEGTTAPPKNCSYGLVLDRVVDHDNNTPDPADDYEDYIFKKTDSCRDVTGEAEVHIRPDKCCIQQTQG